MSDPRFDSSHLLCPRRQKYRCARDAVLGARGWLTLAGECAAGLVGDPGDWPSLLPVRPDQVLPGTRYLLIDPDRDCAYPLRTGLNTIGRLPSNDIVLEDIFISRRHCVILVHSRGSCELHDTASRNGTLVNHRYTGQPVRLSSGDEIKICSRRLLFLSEKDCLAEAQGGEYPDTACV